MASNGPQCKDRLNIFREMAYSSKCEQLYLRETTKGHVYPSPPPKMALNLLLGLNLRWSSIPSMEGIELFLYNT